MPTLISTHPASFAIEVIEKERDKIKTTHHKLQKNCSDCICLLSCCACLLSPPGAPTLASLFFMLTSKQTGSALTSRHNFSTDENVEIDSLLLVLGALILPENECEAAPTYQQSQRLFVPHADQIPTKQVITAIEHALSNPKVVKMRTVLEAIMCSISSAQLDPQVIPVVDVKSYTMLERSDENTPLLK